MPSTEGLPPAYPTRQILTYQDRLISRAEDKTLTMVATINQKQHACQKRQTTGIAAKTG